jgi:hypothetical protein
MSFYSLGRKMFTGRPALLYEAAEDCCQGLKPAIQALRATRPKSCPDTKLFMRPVGSVEILIF